MLGWSWGTTLMATYTTQNAAKVERLVLYAPAWIRNTPSLVQSGPGPIPAYRMVRRDQALGRWLTGVADDKKASLIPAGWFDAWADATWATDPEGGKMDPPVLRAPNGVVIDGAEFFGAGKAYYDPSKITVPTLLVLAEWDKDTPPYMAQTLFPLLTNSPGKRYVALAEGTHSIIMEKNRLNCSRRCRPFSMRRLVRDRLGARVEGDVRHAHRYFKSHCPEWWARGACHRAGLRATRWLCPALQCFAVTNKSGSSPAATNDAAGCPLPDHSL